LTNRVSSQRTFTNLPIGNHQVDVVARAVDGTEASASVTFETLGPLNDPPATILLTGPPVVSPAPATVTFTWSGEDDRTAVGDLRYTFGITNDWDQAAPTAVTMATFSISQPGIYQFQVRAHDLDGEKDPTAASRHFRVEVVEPPPPPPPAPPETFIIAGPRDGGSQYNPNVTYGFTGTDDSTAVSALLFSWRLDGAPWTPFVPETSADVVLQNWGLHFFEVRAMDGGGRIDPTPAFRHIWLGDIPDPVALATMSAAIVADQVELNWTANLDEIIDFQVERAPASEGPFVAISPRIPASKSGEFRWRDATAPPATTLHYRLAWVERAGQRWSNVVSIDTPVATFRILALAPNPTPGGATLHFALSRESVVSVLVFDIAGRPVRTLPFSVLAAGAHLVAWDGRLDSGEAAPAGAYYVRLEAGGLVATRALMVVR